jgi:hypothetical protein
MNSEPKFCGKKPQQRLSFLNPCCLAPDHEGHCRLWRQEESEEGYGIQTFDAETGETIQFLEINGKFTDIEVAAVIQYLEVVKKNDG